VAIQPRLAVHYRAATRGQEQPLGMLDRMRGRSANSSKCFQLLGFDVMVDAPPLLRHPVPTGHAASLPPYQPDTPRPLSQVDQHRRARLLEINSLPSMSVGSRTDVAIKRPALAGAVALVCGLGLSDTLAVSRFTIPVALQSPSLYNPRRFTIPVSLQSPSL